MANRRQILQMGTVALGMLPIFQPAFTFVSGKNRPPLFYKVIYDDRFSDSVAFADEANILGASVHGTQDDLTDLWYGDLYYRCKEDQVIIAGLTPEPTAFMLAVLGRDVGFSQVFRGEHMFKDDIRLEHRFCLPAQMLRQANSLQNAEEDWGVELANLVCQFTSRETRIVECSFSTSIKENIDKPKRLVSWILAPLNAYKDPSI